MTFKTLGLIRVLRWSRTNVLNVLKVLLVLILYQLITDDSALPKLPKLLKLSKLPISALLPSILSLSARPHITLKHPAKAVGDANRNLAIACGAFAAEIVAVGVCRAA